MSLPLSLPQLRIQVTDAGDVVPTINGEPYEPAGVPCRPGRESMRDIIEGASRDLGTIRIEIIEADGSTYSDTVVSERPTPRDTMPAAEASYAVGFLPGEPVAIAVIVDENTATDDGTACIHLPAAVLAAHRGKVILLGRASGTLVLLGHEG